jgi:hypothetical protein
MQVLLDYPVIIGKVLCLCGYVLDDAVDTGEVPSEVLRSGIEPYMSFAQRCPSIYGNGQNRVEVLWGALIWDVGFVPGGLEHPAPDDYGAPYLS